MATAAIANGGELFRPLLVRSILGPDGEVVQEFNPQVRRRVVSRQVARVVTDMMTTVTEEGGTGIEAALEGYLVAGKTGTAQIADLENGGYAEDSWLASFVGFVPADEPRLAMAVVLVEPVINHYGGQTAGPVFRRIADQTLRYLGVPPRRRGQARRAQSALAEAAAESRQEDVAATETQPETADEEPRDWRLMPDFAGLSMRQALRRAEQSGLHGHCRGNGPRRRAGSPSRAPRGPEPNAGVAFSASCSSLAEAQAGRGRPRGTVRAGGRSQRERVFGFESERRERVMGKAGALLTLADLLEGVEVLAANGGLEVPVRAVQHDSRRRRAW